MLKDLTSYWKLIGLLLVDVKREFSAKNQQGWRNERVGLLASEITKLILNNKIFSFK